MSGIKERLYDLWLDHELRRVQVAVKARGLPWDETMVLQTAWRFNLGSMWDTYVAAYVETSEQMECWMCGYRWKAITPRNRKSGALECPSCGFMMGVCVNADGAG